MTAVMDADLVLTFLVMMLVSWLPVGMACGALLHERVGDVLTALAFGGGQRVFYRLGFRL
ncbi:hypothetical protein ACFY20_45980 [Streptomyces sp. NPDC001312]|uniref:hypothetical protein n=1 Tax=Streptomyces sp. NPDC001312 TaxID=3364561 RepID=UPI003687DC1B